LHEAIRVAATGPPRDETVTAKVNPMIKDVISFRRRSGAIFVSLALVAILVASATLLLTSRPPGEDSPEAGFARDMSVHHAQAVEMAEIVRDKTESEEIRTMAADIALTQQAQIGMMQGWLQAWGLPAASTEPAMSWMGHPTEGRMPGMASPEEINRLKNASSDEADRLFLQLMIPHHQAAIPMARAILERTDRSEVERLAQAIADSQEGEIRIMRDMLRERGARPLEAPPHDRSHPEPRHESHAAHKQLTRQELAASIAHAATQGSAAFLVGLVAFTTLVWLPISRSVGVRQSAVAVFVRWVWALFGLLVIAGMVELSLYAMQASGESFSLGLFEEALLDTRVGHIWLLRLCVGLLTVAATTWAAWRLERPARWWLGTGLGGALLVTLTLLSHATAEGRFLPFLADWLHVVAASLWMGGLLGFTLALWGPMRALTPKQQTELRQRAVRRFSNVATSAVMVLAATGLYAALLHVPSLSALVGTPYGRALVVKLVLVAFVLALGGANFMLRGREPFERLVVVELLLALGVFIATGFLTSLPPASAA
jgi:copper transport protein